MAKAVFHLFLLVSLAAGASYVGAQTPRGVEGEAALERGDELHARMQPRKALDAYRSVLEVNPGHVDALLRASRECAALGRLAGDEAEAARWLGEAEDLARRAVEREPESLGARYRLAAVLDERAAAGGPRRRVDLAPEIRTHARFVLDRDPAHAGAHHVLGRWHAEILRLGGVARFFARHVLGREMVDRASWADALNHLERSVEHAPGVLAFRLTLVEAYLDRDRVADARAQLREILERPSTEPADPLIKQRAQELLKANP